MFLKCIFAKNSKTVFGLTLLKLSSKAAGNVQPPYLTSAPPLSQLVPSTGSLQSSYRRVE